MKLTVIRDGKTKDVSVTLKNQKQYLRNHIILKIIIVNLFDKITRLIQNNGLTSFSIYPSQIRLFIIYHKVFFLPRRIIVNSLSNLSSSVKFVTDCSLSPLI